MNISHTAAFIAVKLYGLTRDPKAANHFSPEVLDYYERLIQRLPKHLSWYHTSLKSSLMRNFFIFSEELLLPGDLMHILCRKYYVDKLIQGLMNAGYEQIVNLGAGFDHLGVFYSNRGTPVFEVDFESMMDQKRSFLEAEGFLNKNLHLVSCDISKERAADKLRLHPQFEPMKKTIFVAEGFFDYLDLVPSERLVEDIGSMHPKNKLVTTFFSLDELNVFHRWVFRLGVSMVGESLKFKLIRDEFVELLEELCLELEDEITHQDMRSDFVHKIGSRLPVMKGFYVQQYGIK